MKIEQTNIRKKTLERSTYLFSECRHQWLIIRIEVSHSFAERISKASQIHFWLENGLDGKSATMIEFRWYRSYFAILKNFLLLVIFDHDDRFWTNINLEWCRKIEHKWRIVRTIYLLVDPLKKSVKSREKSEVILNARKRNFGKWLANDIE